jgi:hypothetical protein
MKIPFVAQTDPGLLRPQNEDFLPRRTGAGSICRCRWEAGDQSILSSDGLSDLVGDQEMLEILWKARKRLKEPPEARSHWPTPAGEATITVLTLGPPWT